MKLYTEEQVRKAIKVASKLVWAEGDILAKLTPIELPSRDMAEEAFTNSSLSDSKEGKIDFINGFIWTIRQILNQNNRVSPQDTPAIDITTNPKGTNVWKELYERYKLTEGYTKDKEYRDMIDKGNKQYFPKKDI